MWVVPLEMAPLTPAQKAVLERIEKRKEMQQKVAKKRKAKTEPVPDTTSEQEPAVVAKDSGAATKRRRVESRTPINEQPEASTSRKVLKKNDDAKEAQENNQATVPSLETPVRRGRRTAKIDETVVAPPDKDHQEQPATSPVKASARRGRKTALVEEPNESPANQTMNEAQLKVLQMLAEKKALKDKGRKSVKPPKEVEPEIVEIPDTDSNSELAVSSTVPETVPRGRRKTTNLETTFSGASSSGKVNTPKRGKPAAKIVPVEISDPEEEEAPPTEEPNRLSSTRLEEAKEEEEDQGPLNATMIAVLEKIKEKKAKAVVKKYPAKTATKKSPKSPSKGKSAPNSAGSSTIKADGPLTPNQLSVLKKIQEKSVREQPEDHQEESSDDEDEDEPRLSFDEIREIFERLSVPLNHREKHFAKRLENEGVYKAVDEGRPLSKEQNAMLVRMRDVLRAKSLQMAAASKILADPVDLTKDELDADEDIGVSSNYSKAQSVSDSDDESVMDCAEVKQQKTFLIFDTNAYLKIFPYCRAVLESDKLKGEPDFEELIMFALFVVIRELDSVSKRRKHLHPPAMAAIRLIHTALQDKTPRIEGQDFASSKAKLADSVINDDYIVNSANILQERGEKVIVVTDDKNLQVKIAMMRCTSLNCVDFMARFHWLTPLITSDIRREVLSIGEDIFARFIESVVTSVVLKGVLAHLAPLPMERRREIFPSEKLATTLALMLKNKTVLQSHSGPFAVLNYDRVAQTLNPLQKFDEGDRMSPKDGERFKFFARFLVSAEVLCRSIASFFPNMESRAELVGAAGEYFQKYLPEDERILARRPEITRGTVEQPSTSRFEPARKALLPTKNPLPTVTKHISELSESPMSSRVSGRRQTALAAAERLSRLDAPGSDSEPELKPRTPRQTRVTRNRNQEPEKETAAEPVYFSFSQGRQAPSRIDAVADISKPFAITPTRPGTRKTSNDPYADLHQSINEEVTATVYEYFQKFGLSICNYTGSCCVKLGVRFSLAFKVSSARLETSLPEVTDSFAAVLQAMKKIIMGSQTNGPARDFLLHSSQVMDAIGSADPNLVNDLPKITPDALLAFSKDPEGKQQLVTGYQQFCDFNNCLEKCWLEAQRS